MCHLERVNLNWAYAVTEFVQGQQGDIDMVGAPVGQFSTRVFVKPSIVAVRPAEGKTGSPSFDVNNLSFSPIVLFRTLALPEIPI